MIRLPPLWKIRRELGRFASRAPALPWELLTRFTATPFYDAVLARKITLTDGHLAASTRVAAYLVYPGRGITASHRRALSHIAAAGYAPLLVSNLPLSESDLATLRPLCWRILQRPNYGYDFGGYRDAILHLAPHFGTLARLALFNDSVWFPLGPGPDWLARAEQTGCDFVGTIGFENSGRADPERFAETVWSVSPLAAEFHYGSFALSIGPALLAAPAFLRFWKRYPQATRKGQTVRLGEIGLTRLVVANGFSHTATCDLATLPAQLARLTDTRLDQVFRRIITMDNTRFTALHQRLATDPSTDRPTKERFILAAAKRIGAVYALPELALHELGLTFLKKAPVRSSATAADTTLAILRDLPPSETLAEIIAEAEAMARHAPQPGGPV